MKIEFGWFIAFMCIAAMVITLLWSFKYTNYGSASWAPNDPVNPTWRSTCDAWVRNDCRRTDWKWNQ